MAELTREEWLALSNPAVPEKMLLAPPVPMWPQDCHAWRARADRLDEVPELADCAPMGTKVTDNDRRLLYSAHMRTVRTPAIRKGIPVTAEPIKANRQRIGGKIAIVIEGPRGTGKSTLLDAIAVYWHRRLSRLYGPDENRIPVVALTVPPPGRGNVRNWAGAFARFLGQEREGGDPTASVIHTMRNARTLLVVVDSIERLRTRTEIEQAFQYLDVISEETGATFVYCGRNAHPIVDPQTRDNDTPLEQDETPWGDSVVLRTSRIGYSDEEMASFVSIVDLFDADLRLFRHERGDLTALAPYLHRRSRGYMRTLSHLICQAAQGAIVSGEERITEELLKKVSLGQTVQL
ncbi:ATP-binding protein [Actinacidiphila glaucinigra]|uniref:ATP-binding protein n=1 Tax=Actinacidiphila glaucinigra TaxID=235986 RepID=UPI0037212F01